jgi:hypothetical protein
MLSVNLFLSAVEPRVIQATFESSFGQRHAFLALALEVVVIFTFRPKRNSEPPRVFPRSGSLPTVEEIPVVQPLPQ